MKKRKWILPVSIVSGVIVLCLVAVVAFGAILSAKGFGISTGFLYFSDNSTYLIDSDDTAMRVSDCSDDEDLFEGYQNGDKVILFHDGVNETYPAQTGGYRIIRLSKGDGTYKPADEVLGIVQTLGDDGAELSAQKVDFDVQYIRTGAQNYEGPYPAVAVIHSVDELTTYYEANKDQFYLERREDPASDSTIGFLDACDKYDAVFFEEHALVFVILEEGSGSTRHNIEFVKVDWNGIMYISVLSVVPEVGTCDMAYWHIMTEVPKEEAPAKEEDVVVYYNGVNQKTKSTTVREAGSYSNITLTIPHDWEYEVEREDNGNEYCIAFWPEGQTEGKIKMWYYTAFGVCGTGLEQEEISVGNYKAWKGTYDGKSVWDFISFRGMAGSYVAMNEGAEKWWNEYGDEAMQILSTVKISEDVITEEQAIEIAKKQKDVEYDDVSARFDTNEGIWTVTLSYKKSSDSDGAHSYQITHEGKVLNLAAGD